MQPGRQFSGERKTPRKKLTKPIAFDRPDRPPTPPISRSSLMPGPMSFSSNRLGNITKLWSLRLWSEHARMQKLVRMGSSHPV